MTEAAHHLLNSAFEIVFWLLAGLFLIYLVAIALSPIWVKKK